MAPNTALDVGTARRHEAVNTREERMADATGAGGAGHNGPPHVLAHEHADNVAVVVVEDLTAGTMARGVVTHDDTGFEVEVRDDVPIGHKVALADLAAGDTAIKYGEDIGKIVAPVRKGGHVHTHNLKTKRW